MSGDESRPDPGFRVTHVTDGIEEQCRKNVIGTHYEEKYPDNLSEVVVSRSGR